LLISTNPLAVICITPWGKMAAGASKRVPYSRAYCRPQYVNRKCYGMTVSCNADGKFSVRCMY
jgi:hypothetical protein